MSCPVRELSVKQNEKNEITVEGCCREKREGVPSIWEGGGSPPSIPETWAKVLGNARPIFLGGVVQFENFLIQHGPVLRGKIRMDKRVICLGIVF